MASSNRHWPSLFKSKPSCAAANHQWQQDIDHMLHTNCHKPNSYAASGVEERTPEPKPRWNPKPEQIRILEAIFNSGTVNPPRDEIRRIRTQLQVYGQVGDANVFYWFQNRKSRSKHKQRHLKSAGAAGGSAACASPSSAAVSVVPAAAAASTSSSSGLDKLQCAPPVSTAAAVLAALFDLPPSPAPQTPFLRPELSLEAPFLTPAICYTHHASGEPSASPAPPSGLDIAGKNGVGEEEEELGMLGLLESVAESAASSSPAATANSAAINASRSAVSEIQVIWSMVFINDVAYEVMAGPLNLRETFGPDAVLLHASGHPVLTDEWGLTLQPLQHGASYYLVPPQLSLHYLYYVFIG
ncbi:WUSCHEL-related homeobox 8 [Platanthera zijinensis]|uniref:WUSCHEL-related homeobox 8 n=1 Tax=Platanthera zijinensis TaxID=2320716 RepID=A0AAP0BV08_9ASPA